MKLQALQYFIKYYEKYHKHSRSPGRFAFTLQDNFDFNYYVIIDIMYIENKSVLYLVDEPIHFQAR